MCTYKGIKQYLALRLASESIGKGIVPRNEIEATTKLTSSGLPVARRNQR